MIGALGNLRRRRRRKGGWGRHVLGEGSISTFPPWDPWCNRTHSACPQGAHPQGAHGRGRSSSAWPSVDHVCSGCWWCFRCWGSNIWTQAHVTRGHMCQVTGYWLSLPADAQTHAPTQTSGGARPSSFAAADIRLLQWRQWQAWNLQNDIVYGMAENCLHAYF